MPIGEDAPGRARSRLLLWAPVALLLGFEFYLSSQSYLPSIRLFSLIPQFDKLEHAGYYLLMTVVAVRAARFGEGWGRRRTWATLLVGAAVYGALDEVHQSFVPQRSVEAADVLADILGAFVGLLVSERLWLRLRLESPGQARRIAA